MAAYDSCFSALVSIRCCSIEIKLCFSSDVLLDISLLIEVKSLGSLPTSKGLWKCHLEESFPGPCSTWATWRQGKWQGWRGKAFFRHLGSKLLNFFSSSMLYTKTIIHRLSIYTSMKHSLLSLKHLALALNSLDTLSNVRIKAFMFLF